MAESIAESQASTLYEQEAETARQDATTTREQIKLVPMSKATITSLLASSPDPESSHSNQQQQQESSSFLGRKLNRLKSFGSGGGSGGGGGGGGTRKDWQYVRMPKSDYEKFFARDAKGRYVGTESEGCEEGRVRLKEVLADEGLQAHGRRNIEEEIYRDWKPLKERSGWGQTSVGAITADTPPVL